MFGNIGSSSVWRIGTNEQLPIGKRTAMLCGSRAGRSSYNTIHFAEYCLCQQQGFVISLALNYTGKR